MIQRMRSIEKYAHDVFGLDRYTLGRTHLHREIHHNQTHYLYNMEWFPNGVEQIEEDLNPPGTASIDIDVHTRDVKSLIFVEKKRFTDSVALPEVADVIHFVEKETHLRENVHFRFSHQEGHTYHFTNDVDGTPLSPQSGIEVRVDEEGKLVYYSSYGPFPSRSRIEQETFSLRLEDIEETSERQVQLIEFPVMEQKKIVSIYAVEEIYVSNDGASTQPFAFGDRYSHTPINQAITFENPLPEEFHIKPLKLEREASEGQALTREPHPDLVPITNQVIEQATAAINRFMRMEYPDDSGLWMWDSLYRENGYLIALLKKEGRSLFTGKVKVLLQSDGRDVLNAIDSQWILDMIKEFEPAKATKITKEEAYEKLKDTLTLTPVYVYHPETGHYHLHGKLDSAQAVDAHTGEVLKLSDL